MRISIFLVLSLLLSAQTALAQWKQKPNGDLGNFDPMAWFFENSSGWTTASETEIATSRFKIQGGLTYSESTFILRGDIDTIAAKLQRPWSFYNMLIQTDKFVENWSSYQGVTTYTLIPTGPIMPVSSLDLRVAETMFAPLSAPRDGLYLPIFLGTDEDGSGKHTKGWAYVHLEPAVDENGRQITILHGRFAGVIPEALMGPERFIRNHLAGELGKPADFRLWGMGYVLDSLNRVLGLSGIANYFNAIPRSKFAKYLGRRGTAVATCRGLAI